jgi:Nuclease-related domain
MRVRAFKDGTPPAENGAVWGRLVTRLLERVEIGRRRRRLTHGERQLIDRRAGALLRNRRALVQVVAVTSVGCLVELLLLSGAPEYRGFVAGALAASVVWLIKLKLWKVTWRETRGVEAKARSAELVSAVPEWLVVDGLFVHGCNIDHVVVTPLAVLAVETTWWGEASPQVHRGRRQAAIEQAQANAVAVRNLLRSRGLGFDLPVWPVVIAWGLGAELTQLGRVDVVAGEDAGSWMAAYRTGAIHPELATQVHAALLAYQARNDEHRLRSREGRASVAA